MTFMTFPNFNTWAEIKIKKREQILEVADLEFIISLWNWITYISAHRLINKRNGKLLWSAVVIPLIYICDQLMATDVSTHFFKEAYVFSCLLVCFVCVCCICMWYWPWSYLRDHYVNTGYSSALKKEFASHQLFELPTQSPSPEKA